MHLNLVGCPLTRGLFLTGYCLLRIFSLWIKLEGQSRHDCRADKIGSPCFTLLGAGFGLVPLRQVHDLQLGKGGKFVWIRKILMKKTKNGMNDDDFAGIGYGGENRRKSPDFLKGTLRWWFPWIISFHANSTHFTTFAAVEVITTPAGKKEVACFCTSLRVRFDGLFLFSVRSAKDESNPV